MIRRVCVAIIEGIIWGSVLLHASGLWGPVIRWTRGPSLVLGRSVAEQTALCLTALIFLTVEPMAYLFYTVQWVGDHGPAGFLALAVLALAHLASWTLPPVRALARRLEAKAR
ncbi:MAG: hypothetical protein ACUVXD_06400 [Thermodesulfobacteriota bacterium]